MLPGNLAAWWLYQKLQLVLLDGTGGVNLPGISSGLDEMEVPRGGGRQEILEKLFFLLSMRKGPGNGG